MQYLDPELPSFSEKRTIAKASKISRGTIWLTSKSPFKPPQKFVELPYTDECTAKGWADIMCEEGASLIHLTGQETSTWGSPGDLENLISYIDRRGVHALFRDFYETSKMNISLYTEGLFSEKRLKKVIKSGLSSLTMRIDHYKPEEIESCLNYPYKKMMGKSILNNLKIASKMIPVYAYIPMQENNLFSLRDIVKFVQDMGVKDVYLGNCIDVPNEERHISKHVISAVSGIYEDNNGKMKMLHFRCSDIMGASYERRVNKRECAICCDELTVAGDSFYKCYSHMRNGGQSLGILRSLELLKQRTWYTSINGNHNEDEICEKNCPDICRWFNNDTTIAKKRRFEPNEWQKFHSECLEK